MKIYLISFIAAIFVAISSLFETKSQSMENQSKTAMANMEALSDPQVLPEKCCAKEDCTCVLRVGNVIITGDNFVVCGDGFEQYVN